MKLLISEIIKKASNAKTKAEKIKILQENNTQTLRSILKWNFEPTIESIFPKERFHSHQMMHLLELSTQFLSGRV